MKTLLLIATIFLLTSCFEKTLQDDSQFAQQQTFVDKLLSDQVTEFAVTVLYEHGATPYVGALGSHDTWDVTHTSFSTLFQNHPGRTVTEPHNLSSMVQFEPINRLHWSPIDLLELASQLNLDFESDTLMRPMVIFIKGYYGNSADTLGVQLTGYPIAFIFKDAILAVGGSSLEQKYIEQAVIVHELGHAVGLTNFGIPLKSDHEDPSHPSHTTSTHCIMNWKGDSGGNILSLITPFINANSLNLFGSQSLSEAQDYHP